MIVAAIVLNIGWLCAGMGWRMLSHWRRTADTGFRGISGHPRTLRWWISALFPTALLTIFAAPAAQLAGLPALGWLHRPILNWAGLVLAVVGIAATVAAQRAMGRSWRAGVRSTEKTELVTTGPFRLVRNPIFTTVIVTAIGTVAVSATAVSLAGLTALVIAVQLQVRLIEEPHLHRVHGPAYATYAARVGRFVPTLGRMTPPPHP
jgi:protein-S-isoprenylcysteine O-methyltransferase Ste14